MLSKCTICMVVVAGLGLLLLISGLWISYFAPPMIKNKIAEAVVLANGSAKYESWLHSPAPVYVEFYFFNVVNSEAVVYDSAKPELKQIGPFTYRKIGEKTFVEFSEDGTYVDYKENTSYVFQRDKSVGPEDTWFMGVNLPVLTLSYRLEDKLGFMQMIAITTYMATKGVSLFQNYTVKEYLWGYQDSFFTGLKSNLRLIGYDEMASMLPHEFGLFIGAKGNGTNDGLWRINTGKKDVAHVNEIISWQGNSSLTYWNSEWANMINGTDASTFHPFIEKDEELPMFTTSLCRSGSFAFKKAVKHKGLNLYRFTLKDDLLASVDENPNNSDFCTPPGNCLPRGVLNISNCANGAPIILSQPHFYGADKQLLDAVEGLRPSADLQSMLDIDPKTGAVLHGRKLLQFNAYISPLHILGDTLNMNSTVFPVMWVNETGGITEDGAARFWKAVYAPGVYLTALSYLCIGLGGFVLVCMFAVSLVQCLRQVCPKDSSIVFKKDQKKSMKYETEPGTQVTLISQVSDAHMDNQLTTPLKANYQPYLDTPFQTNLDTPFQTNGSKPQFYISAETDQQRVGGGDAAVKNIRDDEQGSDVSDENNANVVYKSNGDINKVEVRGSAGSKSNSDDDIAKENLAKNGYRRPSLNINRPLKRKDSIV